MKDIMIEVRIVFMMYWTDASFFKLLPFHHIWTNIEVFAVRRQPRDNYASSRSLLLLLLLQPLIVVASLDLVRVWVDTVLSDFNPDFLVTCGLTLQRGLLCIDWCLIRIGFRLLIRVILLLVLI